MKTKIKLTAYSKTIKDKLVLDNISLTLNAGKVYKLCGTNGSGKTMLLRALAGLIYPTEGELHINDIKVTNTTNYPTTLGVMIETPQFWSNYTGFEVLKYLGSIRGVIRDDEIKRNMQRMGLDPDDKRKIEKYSLGMKQKLGIVQAIMEKPEILLLDEPLNALDSASIKHFEQIINEERNRGALIVLALHNDGEFEMKYDSIIKIEEGRIVPNEK